MERLKTYCEWYSATQDAPQCSDRHRKMIGNNRGQTCSPSRLLPSQRQAHNVDIAPRFSKGSYI